jgi:hypothetical protein
MKRGRKTKISFADLYAMYLFVSEDANRSFGGNEKTRKIVREKQEELKDELYIRVYGSNPYNKDKEERFIRKTTIDGEKPENINFSKIDDIIENGEKAQPYVVVKNTAERK